MIEPIQLLIGGKMHQAWESYRIDSDLLTPADDWQVSAAFDDTAATGNLVPDFIFEGAPVKVMLADDVILNGLIDTVEHETSKYGHHFELSGRDYASQLLDCSAPLLSLQMATLDQIVTKAVKPFGIDNIEYRAQPSAPRKKVHIEPGQSAWEWLQSACEANQVWPWFEPNGTLVIGAPDYTTPPIASLILRFSGEGNNVISLRRLRNLQYSFSEVTVLGQATAEGNIGQNNIKGVAKDESLTLYRPHIVVDGNCETIALATQRANKILADGRMMRDRLIVKVPGHRIMNENKIGQPWTPGVRIHLLSEPHRIDAVYFLIKRIFTLSLSAQETELHLIPDGTWLLNMPATKDRQRSHQTKKHYAHG